MLLAAFAFPQDKKKAPAERSVSGIVTDETGAVLDVFVRKASLSVVVSRPSRRSQRGRSPGTDSSGLPFALNL